MRYIKATVPVAGYEAPIVYSTQSFPDTEDAELIMRNFAVQIARSMRENGFRGIEGEVITYQLLEETEQVIPFKKESPWRTP